MKYLGLDFGLVLHNALFFTYRFRACLQKFNPLLPAFIDVRFTELLNRDSGFLAYLERNLSMPTDLANELVNATFNGSQVTISF